MCFCLFFFVGLKIRRYVHVNTRLVTSNTHLCATRHSALRQVDGGLDEAGEEGAPLGAHPVLDSLLENLRSDYQLIARLVKVHVEPAYVTS